MSDVVVSRAYVQTGVMTAGQRYDVRVAGHVPFAVGKYVVLKRQNNNYNNDNAKRIDRYRSPCVFGRNETNDQTISIWGELGADHPLLTRVAHDTIRRGTNGVATSAKVPFNRNTQPNVRYVERNKFTELFEF